MILAPVISSPHDRTRGVRLMIASSFFFTANVLLVRTLSTLESVNVWLVAVVRFGSGLTLIYALYRRQFQFRRLFTHSKLIGRGLAGGASVYGFYLTIVELGAGRATFIGNTYVIFAAALAVWLLKERFTFALAAGSATALGGLALLTHVFEASTSTGIYDLIAVLSALASAYVLVTIRQLHATDHTATIFGAQCVYGLILCGLPALRQLDGISAAGWGLMLAAGLCASLGQITMTAAFRELPVAEGSLLQMVVPVGIALGGWLFFGEYFTFGELVGAVLILVGTAWLGRGR